MTILPNRNKRRLDQRDQDAQNAHHSINSANQAQPGEGSQLVLPHGSHGHLGNLTGHLYQQSLPIRQDNHRAPSTSEKRNRRSPQLRPLGGEESLYASSKNKKRRVTSIAHPDNHGHNASSKTLSLTLPYSHIPSTSGREPLQTLIPPVRIAAGEHLSPSSHKLPGGARDVAERPHSSPRGNEPNGNSDEECSSPACNSEDEYGSSLPQSQFTPELEQSFEKALMTELGLHIKHMEMDGSCLFRAVADQVYGDQDMHDAVREHCLDYMAKNADHFSQYITEEFDTYLQRKRQLGCHGNHIEVQALSEMYNRPIEVYQYTLKPINIFHGSYSPESAFPIRLSYHRNAHYNSLVDPNKPSIGVGLGLPGLRPGIAEQSLLTDAIKKSEEYQLEQSMLQDKMRETDWEITDEALQEQVAKESYLQWLKDCEKRRSRQPACTVTGPSCSASDEHDSSLKDKSPLSCIVQKERATVGSPKSPKPRLSPVASGSSANDIPESQATCSCPVDLSTETKTFLDVEPFTVYGYNSNLDESEALARAIAESQQEYMRKWKKKH